MGAFWSGEISKENFCSRILSHQVSGEDLDRIFRCHIIRWGLWCGSPIRILAAFVAYSVFCKMHAHCYYMEISCSIFLSMKCFVHWISSLTGWKAVFAVAGSYPLLLQRNNTIQSFTCITISLVSKEIQRDFKWVDLAINKPSYTWEKQNYTSFLKLAIKLKSSKWKYCNCHRKLKCQLISLQI